MGRKKHVVNLSDEERSKLEEFVSTGEHRAEDITRAKILLKADEELTDPAICEYLNCSISTPYRTRKAYAEEGSRRLIAASPIASTNLNSMDGARPTSSRLPAHRPRKATHAGRTPSSPSILSHSRRSCSTRSPWKPSDSG
jgi:hypothetical protein